MLKEFLGNPVFSVLLLMGLLVSGCATPSPEVKEKAFSDSPYRDLGSLEEGTILHIPTGVEVSKEQLFRTLSGVRIIYIGETHTNMRDHEIQLEILKEMTERFPDQISVGMEMFQRSSQDTLNRWSRGDLDETEFMREWHANWSQDYAYYRDILRYIRDNRIPLVALNVSNELIQTVMAEGIEGLPDELKKEIPEMDLSDPYHRKALQAVFGGHGNGERQFDRFYQTMLLWDETMAQSVADYLSGPEGQGKKMLVLTGGFHVNYGFGIPRRAFQRLPEPYSIVLPYTTVIPEHRPDLIMDVEPVTIPLYLADFVWAVEYKDLEEEGVKLGVQIEGTEEGVRVIGVEPGSTAFRMGIQKGDILVSFEGEPVQAPFDLIRLIGMKKEGDSADVGILREGESLQLQGRFGPIPEKSLTTN